MITDTEKRECAEREVKMRRRVYPRWVAEGRMKQAEAERQIAVMEAIAQDYRGKDQLPLDGGAERDDDATAMDQAYLRGQVSA